MKNQRLKLTAIKALLFAALLGFASFSWAQVVGTIAHLSGPLVAKKPNGSVKVLAVKSEVENGDTLVAEKNTYAQIKFVDNGEITLRPGTVFKIEKFAYDASKPEGDAANFDLVKGGLRSVTGLLGKRNKEKFALKTPSATIGIRGTTFIAQYVPPPPSTPGMAVVNNVDSLNAGGSQGKQSSGGTGVPAGTLPTLAPQGTGMASQLTAALGTGTPPLVLPGGQLSGAVLPPPTGTGQSGQLSGASPTLLGGGGLGSAGAGQSGQLSGPTPTLLGSGGLGSAGPGQSGQLGGASPTLLGSGGLGSAGTGQSGQLGGASATLQGSGGLGAVGTQLAGQSNNPTPTPPGSGGPGSVGAGLGGSVGAPVLTPGLHLQVTDGAIIVTNNGGSLGFQAGQFGYVPSVNQPPVIVPSNPNIQFVPPPAFNSGSSGPTASNGPGQGTATDCIVR